MAFADHQDFTDDQKLCHTFSVFEEIRKNDEVPDVIITVRLLAYNVFPSVLRDRMAIVLIVTG